MSLDNKKKKRRIKLSYIGYNCKYCSNYFEGRYNKGKEVCFECKMNRQRERARLRKNKKKAVDNSK